MVLPLLPISELADFTVTHWRFLQNQRRKTTNLRTSMIPGLHWSLPSPPALLVMDELTELEWRVHDCLVEVTLHHLITLAAPPPCTSPVSVSTSSRSTPEPRRMQPR